MWRRGGAGLTRRRCGRRWRIAGVRCELTLILTPNIPDPDGFYEFLVGSQRALSAEAAAAMNARLILILCNHFGDAVLLKQAIGLARDRSVPS